MGAVLEYAARRGQQLMLYVFSDGSLDSDGTLDNSAAGRGKGNWKGDNQSTRRPSSWCTTRPAGRSS